MAAPRMAERPLNGGGGSVAVLQKSLFAYRGYWKTTVIVSFITPVFYLLALGVGLGTLVDARGGGDTLGIPYLAYVAPALIAVTGMQIGASEATFPLMQGFLWDKTFHATHATPVTPTQIVNGLIAFVGLRVLSACTVFYVIVAIFGGALTWTSVLVILVSTYGALAICVPIMIVSTIVEKDGAFNYIFRFVIVPMMLFAGTFYPITELPQWGQVAAWVTPLWHTNELARAVALGPVDGTSVGELSLGMIAVHVAYLALFLGAGYLAVRRGFTRKLVV